MSEQKPGAPLEPPTPPMAPAPSTGAVGNLVPSPDEEDPRARGPVPPPPGAPVPAPSRAPAPAASPGPVPGSLERGTPSPQLQQTIREGTADEAGNYEAITDAAPEQGVFHIVGGYLDDHGNVHSEVHLRSMDGHDEDLLGNRGVPILDRLNTIVKKCTLRMGDIIDQAQIGVAIDRLPIGSRTHLLICLRRTTHWKKTKDIYEMEARCPYDGCQQKHAYAVDLSTLDTFDMPNPTMREHKVHLDDAGIDAVWRVASTRDEKVLDLVTDKDDTAALTYSIMVRMVSMDDQDMRLSLTDLLTPDHKKLRFSPKAKALYDQVKGLTSGDRDEFREAMLREEPGIDTDLVFDCKGCKREFQGSLDIAQEGFWFPSVASRRSKTKSST